MAKLNVTFAPTKRRNPFMNFYVTQGSSVLPDGPSRNRWAERSNTVGVELRRTARG
jgi:hypothetical protein